MAIQGRAIGKYLACHQIFLGLWLAATLRFDIMGRLWSAHGSISGDNRVFEYLKAAPSTVVLDAIYQDQDEEYRDARM